MAEPREFSKDPDRFDPAKEQSSPGQGQTLPELLGAGAQESRDNWQWLYGLAGVLGFLLLVSVVITLL